MSVVVNPPLPQSVVICSNTQVSGTGSGTSTSGSWQTATLNTKEIDTDNIATLAANQIALPVGTYECDFEFPCYQSDAAQCRIYNVTAGAVLLNSPTQLFPVGSGGLLRSIGRFVLASASTIRLEYRVATGIATNGQGLASGWSNNERYAVVKLTKVA